VARKTARGQIERRRTQQAETISTARAASTSLLNFSGCAPPPKSCFAPLTPAAGRAPVSSPVHPNDRDKPAGMGLHEGPLMRRGRAVVARFGRLAPVHLTTSCCQDLRNCQEQAEALTSACSPFAGSTTE
jgi:hypothetical protein